MVTASPTAPIARSKPSCSVSGTAKTRAKTGRSSARASRSERRPSHMHCLTSANTQSQKHCWSGRLTTRRCEAVMSKENPRDQRLLEASPVVAKARALAAAGHHAAVVEFLGAREQSELDEPTLALFYGIAQARLGRHAQGLQWIDRALNRARQLRDYGVERHALNARGAIAL